MFLSKKNNDDATLQDLIDDTLNQMQPMQKDTQEFTEILETLKALYALKKQDASHKQISADKVLEVAANIGGILLVLNFERAGIITSKAFSLVTKLKL